MNSSTFRYLQVLGLKSDSTPEEIKSAFKRLAFQYHPDRNPHNEWAEEKFKDVVEAYSFLSGNREAYHAMRAPSRSAGITVEQAEDIYKTLFDIDITPVATRPQLLETTLSLTLEEAFCGGEAKLEIDRRDLCFQCQGSGVEEGAKTFTCTYCFGAGEVGLDDDESTLRECPKCNGRGILSSRGCVHCRARGVVDKSIKLKVRYPPKVRDGQVLTLEGEGHEYSPGERSDVKVTIHLKKHPRFSFDGKDIICEITVEMSDAALGGDISIPTLGGSKKFYISPGTQSGQVLRLRGLGLGGDQFVRVWVKTPRVVSEKEKILLRGLKSEKGRVWNRIKKWIW